VQANSQPPAMRSTRQHSLIVSATLILVQHLT
jgi:hypothetical protein